MNSARRRAIPDRYRYKWARPHDIAITLQRVEKYCGRHALNRKSLLRNCGVLCPGSTAHGEVWFVLEGADFRGSLVDYGRRAFRVEPDYGRSALHLATRFYLTSL